MQILKDLTMPWHKMVNEKTFQFQYKAFAKGIIQVLDTVSGTDLLIKPASTYITIF